MRKRQIVPKTFNNDVKTSSSISLSIVVSLMQMAVSMNTDSIQTGIVKRVTSLLLFLEQALTVLLIPMVIILHDAVTALQLLIFSLEDVIIARLLLWASPGTAHAQHRRGLSCHSAD